jgi:DNA-binding response OmpR family regulator
MADELKNNKKILIVEVVEDESSLRNALKDKLEREGFIMLEAKNGEEGLEVALSEHPDLILLDIIMPQMDGLTMMKKLRHENEWGKSVPIILLTNLSADDEKINQAITESEPAYYLVKSNWTINDLIGKIRERLSRQQ